MLATAITCSIFALLIDYANPAERKFDILAAYLYAPAAIAWVSVLNITGMFTGLSPVIKWWAGATGLLITILLSASMFFRGFPVVRKLIVPISDAITGLGSTRQRDINQKLIICCFAAALLGQMGHGSSLGFVAAMQRPVIDIGNAATQKLGREWLGYPG